MAISHTFALAHADIMVNRVGSPDPQGIGELHQQTTFRVRLIQLSNSGEYGQSEITFIGVPQHETGGLVCYRMEREAKELQARGVNLETAVRADWLEEQGCPKEWVDKLRDFDRGF